MRTLSRLCFAIAVTSLAGCPGSGSDSSDPTVTQGPVTEGPVTGTLTITAATLPNGQMLSSVAGTFPVRGAFKAGGYGYFYDSAGDYFVLPALNQAVGPISGTGTSYWKCGLDPSQEAGLVFCNYGLVALQPILGDDSGGDYAPTGSVNDDQITASFTYSVFRTFCAPAAVLGCPPPTSPGSTFDLTPSQSYSGTPRLIPGHWQGAYPGAAIDVQSDGTFTGINTANISGQGGCAISGTITQVSTGENLFNITLEGDYGGSFTVACPPKHPASFTGLGFLSDTGSGSFTGLSGTYFVMAYSNTYYAHVVQFKIQ